MRGFLSDCKKYEKAKSHMSVFKTWQTFNAREARDQRVEVMISQARREEIQQHNKEVSQNREMLKNITESGVGGDSCFTGVSSDTQNDLIHCLDADIEDYIVQGIKDCTFLSIEVEETTDVSTKEQLSIIIRLNSGIDIVERSLKFVDVSIDRTAATLTGVIKGVLDQYSGVTNNNLIMQTYGGASVMSGHIGGVQALMLQHYPFRAIMNQDHLSSVCRISIHKDILMLKENAQLLHEQVLAKFVEKLRS